MKGPAKGAVFLERRSYRQRRQRDAARMLPVLGIVLWFIPLLWGQGSAPATNAGALIYIFATWLVLIVLAFVVARLTSGHAPDPGQDGAD
jgi:lipopolysaccharide export LptBFGC system permease protein LptF